MFFFSRRLESPVGYLFIHGEPLVPEEKKKDGLSVTSKDDSFILHLLQYPLAKVFLISYCFLTSIVLKRL